MINIDNSLVLMIDVQEKLVRATDSGAKAEKAAKFLNVANILNIPVIVTEQYPQGLGSTVPALSKQIINSSKVFEKKSFSALAEDGILNAITSENRKNIVVFGIETHICVYQTCLELIDRGFNVVVVKDLSSSRESQNHKTALKILEKSGAIISTMEIILFEWLKTSTHPNFKEVQAIILK